MQQSNIENHLVCIKTLTIDSQHYVACCVQQNNDKFVLRIEDLNLKSRKDHIVVFIKKHFKKNIDYIEIKGNTTEKGGRPTQEYLMTQECFDLVKSTYNLKHRYVKAVAGNEMKNSFLMSCENATIGFIENAISHITPTIRQYRVLNYKIDLYIPEWKLAVECDEFDHRDREKTYEEERQDNIEKKLECKFVRFDPQAPDFDLAALVGRILQIGLKKT
jgi:hypothetical protein